MGRLTDSGVMASCEVDIYGALTMLIQHRASLSKVAPHFIDWTSFASRLAVTAELRRSLARSENLTGRSSPRRTLTAA